MKRKLLIFSTLSLTLLLSACSGEAKPSSDQEKKTAEKTTTTQPKSQTEVNQAKIKSFIQDQDKKIKSLTDEVDYYKQYVKDLAFTLSPEQLQQLVDKEWSYSLTINNIEYPKNGVVELSQKDFSLVLKEERVKYSVLPEEESVKGKLTEELNSSLDVNRDTITPTIKEDSADHSNTLIYSFKGMSPGTVIPLSLSDELTKKLGLDTNGLEIRITK